MLWSNRLQIIGFSAIALLGTSLLAGCTLTPVYSGRLAETPKLDLAFAKPATRLDQIVTQELAFRFGNSDAPNAKRATVTTYAGAAVLVNTVTANPNKANEVTVTATLTIAPPATAAGEKPITLTRQASADYQNGAQILNDQAAYAEAQERAAKAVAESLRLALLASLVR